jgi:hypothetical protein
MKKFENWLNVATSFGATIVIVGAWQKITHQSSADVFLTVGLLTEAVIFALYGILYMKSPMETTTVTKNEVVKVDTNIEESVNLNKEKMNNLNKTIDELNSVYAEMLNVMRKK